MRGQVRRISDPLKNFGFIRAFDDNGVSVNENVFYHFVSVNEDPIGRRRPVVGDDVEFDLVQSADGRFRAENVTNLSALQIDPSSHREWSYIKSWKPAEPEFGRPALGWLERESGDAAVLLPVNIQDFGSVEDNISIGFWVFHGIQKSDRNDQWLATDAIVHFPEDETSDSEPLDELSEHFLDVEELPLSEPELERLQPGHVYLPSEKRMTLREIISKRGKSRAA